MLASVLRSMPLFDENDSMVRRHEWTRWREDLQTKRAELTSGGIPADVFGILNGDEAVLRRHARTWCVFGWLCSVTLCNCAVWKSACL